VSIGFWRAAARLMVLQASWTYERLQGIGIGFVSLPLLSPLRPDAGRYRAAVARSVEYFNAHPYLAGIAVGAGVRAELDGVPEARIRRLKTALAGPLGAMGDQLFWIGVVPAVLGALLVGIARGGGVAVVAVGLAVYLAVRLAVTAWALRTGLAAGLEVASALKASGLAGQVRRVGYQAGFAVGLALPVLVAWYGEAGLRFAWAAAGTGTLAGVVAGLLRRRLPSARRVTLLTLLAVIVGRWALA
jgi:mannose/fructose/N-acetylgalactosamine-specific phosphotransferase system component IID